jgi:general secretion pathway protein H
MAALSGKTCRLVFDIPNEKNEEGQVSWRAECAKSGITAGAKREDELALAKEKNKDKVKNDDRFRRLDTDGQSIQALQAREKMRVEEAASFAEFSTEEVSSNKLPSSVKLEVWTQKQRQAVKSGPAYLYFFPQGYTERAQIWLRQGSNVWTLTVAPLTGKTIIHAEDLKVPNT